MNLSRLEANISIGAIIVHVIVWALLTLVTFGVALFFYPYAFGRVLLNDAYVLDDSGRRVARLRCEANVGNEIGHIVLWFFITLITLGIGGFFYAFKAFTVVLNNTKLVPITASSPR